MSFLRFLTISRCKQQQLVLVPSGCPSRRCCASPRLEGLISGLCLAEPQSLALEPACESILTMAVLPQRSLPAPCCWQPAAGTAGTLAWLPRGVTGSRIIPRPTTQESPREAELEIHRLGSDS